MVSPVAKKPIDTIYTLGEDRLFRRKISGALKGHLHNQTRFTSLIQIM